MLQLTRIIHYALLYKTTCLKIDSVYFSNDILDTCISCLMDGHTCKFLYHKKIRLLYICQDKEKIMNSCLNCQKFYSYKRFMVRCLELE